MHRGGLRQRGGHLRRARCVLEFVCDCVGQLAYLIERLYTFVYEPGLAYVPPELRRTQADIVRSDGTRPYAKRE